MSDPSHIPIYSVGSLVYHMTGAGVGICTGVIDRGGRPSYLITWGPGDETESPEEALSPVPVWDEEGGPYIELEVDDD